MDYRYNRLRKGRSRFGPPDIDIYRFPTGVKNKNKKTNNNNILS